MLVAPHAWPAYCRPLNGPQVRAGAWLFLGKNGLIQRTLNGVPIITGGGEIRGISAADPERKSGLTARGSAHHPEAVLASSSILARWRLGEDAELNHLETPTIMPTESRFIRSRHKTP